MAQQPPVRPLTPDSSYHSRPDSIRPGTIGPDSSRRDSIRPGTISPDPSRPDSIRPGTIGPDSSRRDTVRPGTIGPDSSRRDTVRPDTSRPNSDTLKPRPDTVRPDSAKANPDTSKSRSDSTLAFPRSTGPPGSSGAPTPHKAAPAPFIQGQRQPSRPPLSNLHRKYIPVRTGQIPIDSFSLVPGAFFGKDIPDSTYTLDWVNATLTWKHPPPQSDSVLFTYRTFPYKLNVVARRFNYDSIENYFLVGPKTLTGGPGQDQDNFFSFGNINYNGSFGRSITFGNSQDAVVTSNLNLQISGYLADSIEISAAITDNNIPIQPDGTTADLNEFDKIFLQFKKKNWALTMGDIDLRQNQNYFLNFYKRMQGASFEMTNPISQNVTNKTLVSAAIAKGKFTRNIFQGLEGNQGPYKLQGANNELYFIVLAGTEKVYIDGQLMQRGEDQDYVINYNTAEITFTPNRMITQDARIQVEFEYADRNYLNVNLYLNDEVSINNKLKVRLALFSNSDSRNSPINQSLTADQTKFLNRLGDSINHAFYPVANIDTFAAGKILYKKIDTTYKNAAGVVVHDSAYVFSTDPSTTLYNLSFANVGPGYGNYIPDLNGVNGSVFLWVAPVNGQMQGSYEAAQFLVTPKTQRIMTVGADYSVNKHTSVSAEVATSHYDVNTLSNIDKSNDDGYAAKFQFRNSAGIGASAKGLRLNSNLGYEYVQANFQPLERLRPVEFTRDWGLGLSVNPADEKIYTGGLELVDKKLNSLKYDIARYERGDGFTGMRNILTHKQEIKGWNIHDQLSLTTSDSVNFKGTYWRPSLDISKKMSFLKNYLLGAGWSLEHNEDRDKGADTVTATSFAFQTFQAYLKSPEKNPNHWGTSFATRTNSYPYGKNLALGDRSQTVNLFADFTRNTHHQFHINATYRNLQIINARITNQTADNSMLGRAEYIVNEWKGLLKGNLLYEVGSGQEQKKNYSYLQVPAGTGQYTWIDVNKDGIQQLSEFVLAQFQDQATYIRVYTPTDEYIKANYNTFNYSFTINPKAVVHPVKSTPVLKFFARMTLQSSLQLTQKQQAKGFIQLNPFKSPLDDTSLITRTMILVNTFSFNRSDPHWGFDLSNTRNGSKSLLTYGYEARQLTEWSLRTRLNLNKSIALNATFRQGSNQLHNTGTNFDSSNYQLQQFSAEPALTYTRGGNFRIGMGYRLSYKMNTPELGGQKYTSGALNADFKYNILQSTSIQSKFTYNQITYSNKDGSNASTTSSVSYVILEGLSPGKNYLWNIDLTKKLGSSLELSLQYEGRKAGDANIVHTGRASLRALL
ncbi:MAG TPA: hypothetical protein VL832_05810 [Puia sp.]|nr:hypothetical protein [Puia sp.]